MLIRKMLSNEWRKHWDFNEVVRSPAVVMLRHQLPWLTFDFSPVAYYQTSFASRDPSCFPPLSFTCVSCIEDSEAAKLGINRYKYSAEQWKYCLIKCCWLTTAIISFETVLTLYPWKDFMFTSCGCLQKMLLLTLWCHYVHSKYGAKSYLVQGLKTNGIIGQSSRSCRTSALCVAFVCVALFH